MISVCLTVSTFWLIDNRCVTQMVISTSGEIITCDSANDLETELSNLQRRATPACWLCTRMYTCTHTLCFLYFASTVTPPPPPPSISVTSSSTLSFYTPTGVCTGWPENSQYTFTTGLLGNILYPEHTRRVNIVFVFQCFRRSRRSRPPRPRLRPGASPPTSTRTPLLSWGCCATSPSCSWWSAMVGEPWTVCTWPCRVEQDGIDCRAATNDESIVYSFV